MTGAQGRKSSQCWLVHLLLEEWSSDGWSGTFVDLGYKVSK